MKDIRRQKVDYGKILDFIIEKKKSGRLPTRVEIDQYIKTEFGIKRSWEPLKKLEDEGMIILTKLFVNLKENKN